MINVPDLGVMPARYRKLFSQEERKEKIKDNLEILLKVVRMHNVEVVFNVVKEAI